MYILGVDTTGARMSVALSDDSKILYEIYGDESKKHLETLMPGVENVLLKCKVNLGDIGLFAVSIGPGSFTGIRIGAAAVSALAQAAGKPVAQVDTLSALCRNSGSCCNVCAMIDAGRNEVFARIEHDRKAVFESQPVKIEKLLDIMPDNCILVGDGSIVYREIISEKRKDVIYEPDMNMYQRASSVCLCALEMMLEGRLSAYDEISPEYLRVSQAERLKNAK